MTTTQTQNAQKTVEEIQADLEAATKAYNDLTRELAGMHQRLKSEAKADKDALTAAAMSGTMKSAKTPKLDRARDRAAELPYLIWAAEIRMLQLQDEYAGAKAAELQEEIRENHAVVEEAEKAFAEARDHLNNVRQDHAWAIDELRTVTSGEKHRRGRIMQLEEEGPNV